MIESDKVRNFRYRHVASRESSVSLDFQMLGRENEKPCNVDQEWLARCWCHKILHQNTIRLRRTSVAVPWIELSSRLRNKSVLVRSNSDLGNGKRERQLATKRGVGYETMA